MFDAVIEVLKLLAGGVKTLLQLDDEKRKKFAAECEVISNLLKEFIAASTDRRKALGLCARLREHVQPIRVIAISAIRKDEINRLATELGHVCEAMSKLTSDAQPGEDPYELYLDQLAEGAGMFEGLAESLRAR